MSAAFPIITSRKIETPARAGRFVQAGPPDLGVWLPIALTFVVPAGIVGFYATLGIVKHMVARDMAAYRLANRARSRWV